MDSKSNQVVKHIFGSEFLVNLPYKVSLNLLIKMKIKFIILDTMAVVEDIVAVVDETDMDHEAFQVLQTTQVRAIGIPKLARTEFAVMELACLIGDPEEVHLPSLQWKSMWVKCLIGTPIRQGDF